MTARFQKDLSSDLASLIHHVELSKAGWRDDAFKILLLSIMGRHGGALSLDDLCTLVNQTVPAAVSQYQVRRFLDALVESQQLLRLPDGYFSLSQQSKRQCTLRSKEDKNLRQEIEYHFRESFRQLVDAGDLNWNAFDRRFLIPLVSDLGARTYELVTGTKVEIPDVPAYRRFLSSIPSRKQAAVAGGLVRFFDPKSGATRKYMLRLLNNAFLIQAIALPDEVMKVLLDRIRKPLRLKIFVDTNVLFSLLGLHENPADDIVRTLHDVVEKMSGSIDVAFYVLPFTVDEAQKALERYGDQLTHFYMSPEVARAINSESNRFSGILLTYARKAYKNGKRISAKDYLSPYLNDFIRVARDRGIELFNADVSALSTDDDVVSDTLEQVKLQERRPPERRKAYDAMLHDMKLWHFVKRRRPSRVDSPLDAEAWIATIDYGLLAFDKSNRSQREPPVCIHPTSLLHVLQLWVPSSDLLVGALMESLRPMLPRTIDYGMEDVIIKIANRVSRFELGDLSEDAVAHILLDEAVLEKMGTAANATEEIEIIESEMARVNRQLTKQIDAVNREVENVNKEVEKEREKVHRLESDLCHEKRRRDELETEIGTVRHEAAQEKVHRSRLEKEVHKLTSRQRQAKQRRARCRARTWSAISGFATAGVGLYAWRRIELTVTGGVTWFQHAALAIVVIMCSARTAIYVMNKSRIDVDNQWMDRIAQWDKWLGAVFVAVLAGVLLSLF